MAMGGSWAVERARWYPYKVVVYVVGAPPPSPKLEGRYNSSSARSFVPDLQAPRVAFMDWHFTPGARRH